MQMFSAWDANANGLLPLTEIKAGLVQLFGQEDEVSLQHEIIEAFEEASAARVSGMGIKGNDFVEKGEFRIFLILLKRSFLGRYLDSVKAPPPVVGVWASREAGMITLDEFKGVAEPIIEGWGIDVDPSRDFKEMDKLNSRAVSVGSFDAWARAHVIMHDDVTVDDRPPPCEFDLKMKASMRAGRVKTTFDLTAELDLKGLIAKLPAQLNSEDSWKRKKLFDVFDLNHNGNLNLGEIDLGLRLLFESGLNDEGNVMETAVDALSPAIKRAFHAAKDARKASGAKHSMGGDSSVSFHEFRLLLVYLKKYFELLDLFDEVDTTDDRRVDFAEFEAAMPTLLGWGVVIADPAAEFRKIDLDGGGKLLFDEFSGWALKKGLDRDASDDIAGENELEEHHKMSAEAAAQGAIESKERIEAMQLRNASGVLTNNTRDLTAGINILEIVSKLPLSTEPSHVERRRKLFESFDQNANKFLSLFEVDSGLRRHLNLHGNALTPAIKRAYESAKHTRTTKDGHKVTAVELSQFRMLLVYLKRYLELLQLFDAVDLDDDRRIDLSEFTKALSLIAEWGVHIDIADAEAEFRRIDGNQSGAVLFDEFAAWAIRTDLDKDVGDDVDGEKSLIEMLDSMTPERPPGRPCTPRSPRTPIQRWDSASLDLKGMIRVLPCGTTEADKLGRADIFAKLDRQSTGFLTLQQLDVRLHELLRTTKEGAQDSPRLARGVRLGPNRPKTAGAEDPRAGFLSLAVRNAFRAVTKADAKQYVGRAEFRMMLTYLKYYFTMLGGDADPTPKQSPRRQRSPVPVYREVVPIIVSPRLAAFPKLKGH